MPKKKHRWARGVPCGLPIRHYAMGLLLRLTTIVRRCLRQYSPSIFIVTALSASRLAFAQADAPPHDYANLGPHFIVAPGLGASTEYRDILLRNAASARLGLTATYRGFTVSGFAESSLSSPTTKAHEITATYSHKLPFVDVHLGFTACDLTGAVSGSCGGARFAASSNSLPYTKFDLTLDESLSGRGQTVAISVAQQLWKSGPNQVDLRLSGTHWDWNFKDARGWSVRALGRWQMDRATSIHYHVGFASTRIDQSGAVARLDGAIGGVNFVWEFR